MMTTAISSKTVVLASGLAVSVEALQLLWNFEDRGCTVKETAEGALFVGPRHQLTAPDIDQIRQYRDELLALVRYCETVQ